jgi:hypothetical protein
MAVLSEEAARISKIDLHHTKVNFNIKLF